MEAKKQSYSFYIINLTKIKEYFIKKQCNKGFLKVVAERDLKYVQILS